MVELRTVLINRGRPKESIFEYCSNAVYTTKYNLLTFIPRFLFEQFSRYTNLFFLGIACIQQIPGISPTHRFGVIMPLSFILIITAIKEIIEDARRRKADDRANNAVCEVFDHESKAFVPCKWKDLTVGELVRVSDGQSFPADIILLQTAADDGSCYIETANIDGETSLKSRQGPALELCEEFADSFTGIVRCEIPNNRINEFEGVMLIGPREISLNANMICLRGANLRNTGWIIGAVLYTGVDTKIVQNSHVTPSKRSSIDEMTNRQILYLFFLLFCLISVCLVGRVVVNYIYGGTLPYLELPRGLEFWTVVKAGLSFTILLHNVVPISLLVTLELVRVRLGQLLEADIELYCEETDTPAVAKTTCLIEELGQVQYLFSDKTGTLTRNEMVLRNVVFDGEIHYVNAGAPARTETSEWMLLCMAACNTTVLGKTVNNQVVYQSSSPDEVAICLGASQMGAILKERNRDIIRISLPGGKTIKEFQVLALLEFDSTRKRMSIVVLDKSTGKRYILTKGADTSMLPLLNGSFRTHYSAVVSSTEKTIEKMSLVGLRTLVFGSREISDSEWHDWQPKWHSAITCVDGRKGAVERAMQEIEKDFDLVGATGVEDRLQDGVPETITKLHDANINIWILTGDKSETAINIGYSCGLLRRHTEVLKLENPELLKSFQVIVQQGGTSPFASSSIESETGLLEIPVVVGEALPSRPSSPLSLSESDKHTSQPKTGQSTPSSDPKSYALVLESRCLSWILADEDMSKSFVELSKKCRTVICCRVTPLQKAQVVELIQKNVNAVCLAIGDGANDVGMIQAAQIGVGISGKEGLQAARSADFAIAQFRFLQRLLLVHGTWGYQRVSKAATYCLYKNVMLYVVQFWYSFFNLFSGQTLFETWMIGLYNVVFTAWPPIVIGLTNQFITDSYLLSHPAVYRLGQQNSFYNGKAFWEAVSNAMAHSLLSFAIGVLGTAFIIFPSGQYSTLFFMGSTIFIGVVLTTVIKAGLLIHHWTIFTTLGLVVCPITLIFYLLGYDLAARHANMPAEFTSLVGMPQQMVTSMAFWLTILLIPSICLARDFVWKYYRRQFRPHEYHYVQELQKSDRKGARRI